MTLEVARRRGGRTERQGSHLAPIERHGVVPHDRASVRIGIVDADSWARYGHIPALQSLEEFGVTHSRLASRESAERCAAEFEIPRAYDDP